MISYDEQMNEIPYKQIKTSEIITQIEAQAVVVIKCVRGYEESRYNLFFRTKEAYECDANRNWYYMKIWDINHPEQKSGYIRDSVQHYILIKDVPTQELSEAFSELIIMLKMEDYMYIDPSKELSSSNLAHFIGLRHDVTDNINGYHFNDDSLAPYTIERLRIRTPQL